MLDPRPHVPPTAQQIYSTRHERKDARKADIGRKLVVQAPLDRAKLLEERRRTILEQ